MSPPAKWMRGRDSKVAHAFLLIDLRHFANQLEPVGSGCGRFRIAELQEDQHAEKCLICARALAALP